MGVEGAEVDAHTVRDEMQISPEKLSSSYNIA